VEWKDGKYLHKKTADVIGVPTRVEVARKENGKAISINHQGVLLIPLIPRGLFFKEQYYLLYWYYQ
jgi:hypothetical protein